MGSIVNFADGVRNAIEAGKAVEGSNVLKIIADNGEEIANGVKYTVLGGNGAGATITAMTQTASGGGAVTTGLAMLSMDVGAVGLAIAPALGVVAGIGLYNLYPSFWDNLSNSLYNAGKTVAGKVIAFFDGDKMYMDEEVIEIVKQLMVDMGLFDNANQELSGELETPDGTILPVYSPFTGVTTLNFTADNEYDYINHQVKIIGGDARISCYFNNAFCIGSLTPFAYNHSIIYTSKTTGEQITQSQIYQVTTPTSMYGLDVYATTGSGAMYVMPFVLPPYYQDINKITEAQYILAVGEFYSPETLQPDAKYPSDEEFPLTYPTWFPFNYPEIDPTGLPNVYPLKMPEVYPDPYPKQDQAQDPAEDDEYSYPYITPHFPIGLPRFDPWEETEDDPDPEPEDPDPIEDEDDEDEPFDDDPIDPNKEDPTTPVIPEPQLPDTVVSTRLFTVYNPSSANLGSLGAYLWDSSLMASIRDIWQDPLDGIISLIQVYATPPVSGSHNIILGYLDSGVSAPVVSSQFVTIDCGSVTVPENKENATDYAPYTSLHLFLPFIGMVELDSNECMKSSIQVVYKVDVYTGTCLAQVKVTRTKDMPNGPILYTFSGNCSQQIPLTSGNATGVLSALIGGITAGLSVASGGGLGVVAGASIAGQSLTHDMFHVTHSGNISANAGIMGNKKPYLIIGRRHGYDANNYGAYYGFPANKTIVLGNHTGFVKVKKCFVKTSATQPEHDEIMKLLSEGVIL